MPNANFPKITRRSFLKSAAVGAAAATTGPLILNAADKAGSKRPRVGAGEHTYEVYHDWGMKNLPAGHNYGNASHGVTVDEEGLIYITHQGTPDSVFVFDEKSRFVRSFGAMHQIKRGKGPDKVAQGHGIDIRKEDGQEFFYLSPSNTDLFFTKVTKDGELVWKKDRKALNEDSGKLGGKTRFRPTNASFRPDGGYYLGDGYGSNLIFQYDRNDQFVRAIGGRGKTDGKFATPHGQWLDARDGTPKLVVADRANMRLQWFGMDGRHLKTLGGFLFPADIDVQGEIMMVPDLHCRVTLLDINNKVIAQLGDDEAWRKRTLDKKEKMRSQRSKWRPGKFVHPHDACFDRNGDIFVVEWVSTGRVSKLVKVG